MKRLHVIIGLFVVLAFLLTGQYMNFHTPQVRVLDDGMRMMFRSRHIYILLTGLINVGVGAYYTSRVGRWRRGVQLAGSILILLSPFLLLAAFFREPEVDGLRRFFTLPGILVAFVGTLFHLISGARARD